VHSEHSPAIAGSSAGLTTRPSIVDALFAQGVFEAVCYDRDGRERWRDQFKNTVMTEGKNLALDTFLAGATYTVVGPYMGLISSVSYSAIAATDVGSQINGTNAWKEAGLANAPTYTGNRKTCAWSAAAAGAKALSAPLSFAITGTGTIKGCFVLFGSAVLATKDDAHGTLLSAGLFTGGDRGVLSGDTVQVSYSLSL
jgi:hypothetical protein